MNRLLNICWKDLAVLFHDKAALILMLVAPFVLTLGMGAVTGAFSGRSSSGISDIPVMIVNLDEGPVGQTLVMAFQSQDELFTLTTTSDMAAARKAVDDDKVAAVVIIPADFSASMQAAQPGTTAAPIEIYSSPARPISVSVVQSIVTGVISQIEIIPASLVITPNQLVANGRLDPANIQAFVGQMATRLMKQPQQERLIDIQYGSDTQEEKNIIVLAYLAPAMAVFFLMYTVTQASRSILDERDQGTLSRMLISPTHSAQVLGGKVASVFVIAFLQVGILILASSLLFRLSWGEPVSVILLVTAVALGASGWGILLASFAKTPYQVTSFGAALMLLFGMLGGSFVSTDNFSSVMRLLSKITPNAWALDGFTILGTGGGLADVTGSLVGLVAMAVILFGASLIVSRKRWASGFMR